MKLTYNDEHHSYWLDGKRCKGVSGVAKVPDDKTALERWKLVRVAIGLAKRPDIIEAVAVDYDDRDKMDLHIERSMEAAGSFLGRDRGTTLHKVAERHDLGLDLIDTEANVAIRKAWAEAIDAYGLEADPYWVERVIVYPDLRIAGRLDRYMRRRSDGRYVIVDAKGGAKLKEYPHAPTIQLAMYANAPLVAVGLNGGSGSTETFEDPPDVDREVGYVIHMPEDDRAEVIPLKISAGWECFNSVIQGTYGWRSRKDLVIKTKPLAPVAVAASGDGGDAGADGPSPSAPATNDQDAIKARLAELRGADSPLMPCIVRDWPIAKRLNEHWDEHETTRVKALIDRLDIEGPMVDDTEVDRIKALYPTLTQPQAARVVAWVEEAANTPDGRPLGFGAFPSTRRIAIAEACIVAARGGISDDVFANFAWEALGPLTRVAISSVGAILAGMHWQEALTLRDIVLAHVHLNATIEPTEAKETR